MDDTAPAYSRRSKQVLRWTSTTFELLVTRFTHSTSLRISTSVTFLRYVQPSLWVGRLQIILLWKRSLNFCRQPIWSNIQIIDLVTSPLPFIIAQNFTSSYWSGQRAQPRFINMHFPVPFESWSAPVSIVATPLSLSAESVHVYWLERWITKVQRSYLSAMYVPSNPVQKVSCTRFTIWIHPLSPWSLEPTKSLGSDLNTHSIHRRLPLTT